MDLRRFNTLLILSLYVWRKRCEQRNEYRGTYCGGIHHVVRRRCTCASEASAPHLGEPKPSAAPGERQRGPAPGERSEPLHLREAQPSAGTCGER